MIVKLSVSDHCVGLSLTKLYTDSLSTPPSSKISNTDSIEITSKKYKSASSINDKKLSMSQKEEKDEKNLREQRNFQQKDSISKNRKEKYYPCLVDVMDDSDDDDDCDSSSISLFSLSTTSDDDTVVTSNTFKNKYHEEQKNSKEDRSLDDNVKYRHKLFGCISETYCGIKTCFA